MKRILCTLLFVCTAVFMKASDVAVAEGASTAVEAVSVSSEKIFEAMEKSIIARQFALVVYALVLRVTNERLNDQLIRLHALFQRYRLASELEAQEILKEAQKLSKNLQKEHEEFTDGLDKVNEAFKKEFPSYKKAAASTVLPPV